MRPREISQTIPNHSKIWVGAQIDFSSVAGVTPALARSDLTTEAVFWATQESNVKTRVSPESADS